MPKINRAGRYRGRNTPEETDRLRDLGYVDAAGNLTPAGELKLHQLSLMKWMMDNGEWVGGRWRRKSSADESSAD